MRSYSTIEPMKKMLPQRFQSDVVGRAWTRREVVRYGKIRQVCGSGGATALDGSIGSAEGS